MKNEILYKGPYCINNMVTLTIHDENTIANLDPSAVKYDDQGFKKTYDLVHSQHPTTVELLADLGSTALKTNSQTQELIAGLVQTKGSHRINSEVYINNNSLNRLIIVSIDIDNYGMSLLEIYLKDNQSLEYLRLCDTNLNDSSYHSIKNILKTNKSIKSLSICKNPISLKAAHDVANGLKKNDILKSFIANRCDVDDNTLAELARGFSQHKSLKVINLCHNNFSDSGAKELAKVILTSTSLSWLNLEQNRITNDGAQALLTSVTKNIGIYSVCLSSNEISHEQEIMIDKLCKRNLTLQQAQKLYQSYIDLKLTAEAELAKANAKYIMALKHDSNCQEYIPTELWLSLGIKAEAEVDVIGDEGLAI